jgi:hypothetical protein
VLLLLVQYKGLLIRYGKTIKEEGHVKIT